MVLGRWRLAASIRPRGGSAPAARLAFEGGSVTWTGGHLVCCGSSLLRPPSQAPHTGPPDM